jgi:hypothetical protein
MRHGLAGFGRKSRARTPWLTLRGITSEVQRAVLPDGRGKYHLWVIRKSHNDAPPIENRRFWRARCRQCGPQWFERDF